ncbi:hypothetical protein ACFPTR_12710 [Aliibacillus thermotolerans]|uniref:DUF4190 domain-containing protein n=1 Tax=Aliibacillus thermotolerans TaxID=1834418 RepID=A0ABW0U9R1_9BACI|nr:DUF308 domain-containing protein [Aliibacillus thermotolerans]MDA3130712.1 hypothetical protein [Aliibacillus thermotolerans]
MDEYRDRHESDQDETTEKSRSEMDETDFTIETASEIASPGMANRQNIEKEEDREQNETEEMNDLSVGRGLGIVAIILSISSLFFLPYIMGAAGIILGILAVRREARMSGYWSIGIGAFSILMTLFFAPFY